MDIRSHSQETDRYSIWHSYLVVPPERQWFSVMLEDVNCRICVHVYISSIPVYTNAEPTRDELIKHSAMQHKYIHTQKLPHSVWPCTHSFDGTANTHVFAKLD